MLLRYVNQATQSPNLLVKDILSETLDLKSLVIATEALGLISDLSISFPVIQVQLQHSNALVIDAAILSLRLVVIRTQAHLPEGFRKCLIQLATSSKDEIIRVTAAEALADFQFA